MTLHDRVILDGLWACGSITGVDQHHPERHGVARSGRATREIERGGSTLNTASSAPAAPFRFIFAGIGNIYQNRRYPCGRRLLLQQAARRGMLKWRSLGWSAVAGNESCRRGQTDAHPSLSQLDLDLGVLSRKTEAGLCVPLDRPRSRVRAGQQIAIVCLMRRRGRLSPVL
jgi:hypothetical protein